MAALVKGDFLQAKKPQGQKIHSFFGCTFLAPCVHDRGRWTIREALSLSFSAVTCTTAGGGGRSNSLRAINNSYLLYVGLYLGAADKSASLLTRFFPGGWLEWMAVASLSFFQKLF